MYQYISKKEEDTICFASKLASVLQKGDLIWLSGDLGTGKTKFTQGILRHFAMEDQISSPTFTIVNEYEGARLPLFHFDMYRLESAEELFDIGWEDYLNRGGVCAVEWSERVAGALPRETVTVTISRCPKNEDWRKIIIEEAEIK